MNFISWISVDGASVSWRSEFCFRQSFLLYFRHNFRLQFFVSIFEDIWGLLELSILFRSFIVFQCVTHRVQTVSIFKILITPVNLSNCRNSTLMLLWGTVDHTFISRNVPALRCSSNRDSCSTAVSYPHSSSGVHLSLIIITPVCRRKVIGRSLEKMIALLVTWCSRPHIPSTSFYPDIICPNMNYHVTVFPIVTGKTEQSVCWHYKL